MNLSFSRPRKSMTLHMCILAGTLLAGPAYAIEKCDSFAEVRSQIDAVVKTGSPRAEKFRSEVKSGADSLYVIEQLSPPEMASKLDICRYEAVEYLVKLGFPPAH